MKMKAGKIIIILVALLVAAVAVITAAFSFSGKEEPEVTQQNETTQQPEEIKKTKDYIIAEDTEKIFLIDLGDSDRARKEIDTVRGDDGYRECCISKDESKILFINNMRDDDDFFYVYELMLYDIEKEELTSIAETVDGYAYNEDFSEIVYLDASEKVIYRFSSQGREPIAENCIDFVASDDAKTIFCETADACIYLLSEGKEPELVDENINAIYDCSSDCSEMIYHRDGAIVKYCAGEKIVLTENIYDGSGTYISYDKGYFCEWGREVSLEDFVEDDLKGKALTEKEKKIKQRCEGVLRSESLSTYRFYRYDGKEKTVLLEDVIYTYSDSVNTVDTGATVHCTAEGKIKMSELVNQDIHPTNIGTYIYDTIIKQGRAVVVKDKEAVCEVTIKDLSSYVYDRENNVIYFSTKAIKEDDIWEHSYYSMNLEKPQKAELKTVCENLPSNMEICYLINGRFITVSDSDEYSTVYCDGKKVMDISGYSIQLTDDMLMVYPVSDENSQEGAGTAVFYDGKETFEVAGIADYELFEITKENRLVCYQDYKYSVSIVEKDGSVSKLKDIYKYITAPVSAEQGNAKDTMW